MLDMIAIIWSENTIKMYDYKRSFNDIYAIKIMY